MNQDLKKPSSDGDSPEPNNILVILKTLADTTLRMFVPTIVGTATGLYLESQLQNKIFAVAGSILGLIISIFLVWDQYNKVTRKDKK